MIQRDMKDLAAAGLIRVKYSRKERAYIKDTENPLVFDESIKGKGVLNRIGYRIRYDNYDRRYRMWGGNDLREDFGVYKENGKLMRRSEVLYDICLDAIEKLRSSAEGEQSALISDGKAVSQLKIIYISPQICYSVNIVTLNIFSSQRKEASAMLYIMNQLNLINENRNKRRSHLSEDLTVR